MVARTEAANPTPTRFAIAYSTNDVGNSGWQWISAGPEWAAYEISRPVPPMRDGKGDFVGLLANEPGKPGVDICAVTLTVQGADTG